MLLGDSANVQADLPTVFVRMLLGDSANVQADLPTVFVRMLLGDSANVQADLPTVFVRMLWNELHCDKINYCMAKISVSTLPDQLYFVLPG